MTSEAAYAPRSMLLDALERALSSGGVAQLDAAVPNALRQTGERLVHHVTIAFGVTSCVLLVLAYDDRVFAIPALVVTALSFVYSLVDEVFHWKRYSSGDSDVVEMWSHAGILAGHVTMMVAWWWCYELGYPGVRETLVALGGG